MEKIARLLRSKAFAGCLVILGLALTLFFGLRVLRSFRQMPPFPPHPPKPIEAEDGIRPWMNLKYISKVYAIPPDYLIQYLMLPPHTNPARQSLEELNQELKLGNAENGDPLILQRLDLAILDYHAHPDFRENRTVKPTMSLHFIATVTGIPEAYLFEELHITQAGNEYKPLDILSQEQDYAGGGEAMAQEIQRILAAYEGE